MSKKSSSGREIPLWGIFLLFLGVIFLLQTLRIIPWALWGQLVRFWPVLIIIAGIYILLRHSHAWFATVVILLLLFASLGLAIWQYGTRPANGGGVRSYSQPLAGLRQAHVSLDFAAGRLTVDSLPLGSSNLAEAGAVRGEGIRASFTSRNGEGDLRLSPERGGGTIAGAWEVRLSRNIPLVLDIKTSAGEASVDLSNLNVTGFDVQVNAGSMELRLSPAGGRGTVETNLSSLEISIPEGLPARLRADANLGDIDVNETRFPRQGDYYVSRGYDTASIRLDLDLKCNLGRIRVL